ncbi:hypothetical protein [Actinomyces vulturis]|uniref:hypothetical protein n=1 Tax=Actinomyces vulturis TaxID=1857645 RepID=UPI000830AED4|nr:hypothetical protein [Actinomyces vulturis]
MTIDWYSLLLVSGVTVAGASLIVLLTSLGARLLDAAHILTHPEDESNRRVISTSASVTAIRLGAYLLLGIVLAAVLGGLWLMIPYFHH